MFPASDVMTKKRPDTAATQFKNSLNQLMEILMNKEPSYIRCIKPNDDQKSGVCILVNIMQFIFLAIGHSVVYLYTCA